MCKALRIRVLMLALIVVGRNPGSWLQILSLVQLRCGVLSSCLPTWLPWFRTAVLLLSYSWPGSLDLAFLCVSPSEIHFLLLTAWQLAPIKVSMLNGRMDALSNCYVSGQHLLIKVNLSGFRALHMDQGCSHLLADCLRLQRDIHAIKRCQVLLRPCGCL